MTKALGVRRQRVVDGEKGYTDTKREKAREITDIDEMFARFLKLSPREQETLLNREFKQIRQDGPSIININPETAAYLAGGLSRFLSKQLGIDPDACTPLIFINIIRNVRHVHGLSPESKARLMAMIAADLSRLDALYEKYKDRNEIDIHEFA